VRVTKYEAGVSYAYGAGHPMVDSDLSVFEAHRAMLVSHAYRMLGDLERARDMVQDAWLRWHGRSVDVENPKAYLVKLVTRLCLNELDSARTRREESRGDRLPEPIDLEDAGLARVDMLDQVSMAFLVVLQRLTPAERAVFLLREIFEFEFAQIAALVRKTEPACRKLLERARQSVASERRFFAASAQEHRELLVAFIQAATEGNVEALAGMLADDAVMVTDGGPEGREVGGIRNLRAPLQGARKIAAFVALTATSVELQKELRELNGRPALVFTHQGAPFAALLLAVEDERIHRVFFHADPRCLGRLGGSASAGSSTMGFV
jgi:RNA polymerase sigma-70 factor, ECF subfamily